MLFSDLALALDPVLFAGRRLGFAPDDWQASVLQSSSKRLLLNCCRQSGKSTTAAVLALHTALYRPGSLVLLVSPSLRQSSELFRKVADFRDMLRPTLVENNRLSCVFENGSRIVSLPGSEATIRGFSGADLIIEDEASRVSDDLYFAVRPMLAVSAGRLVLMSTPFGKRGHFWETWRTDNSGWEKTKFTAEDCPRITAEFLEEEKQALGDWWFRQEYLCEFLDSQSSAFSFDMLELVQAEEVETWQL